MPQGTPVAPAPSYGQPGYSSRTTYHQTLGKGNGPAPSLPLPPQALRVNIRDEAGHAQVVPVSPTPHHPTARLDGHYANEFGLEVVTVGQFLHRRLPQHFLQ